MSVKSPKTNVSNNGALIQNQEYIKYTEQNPQPSISQPVQNTSVTNISANLYPIEELKISENPIPKTSLKINNEPFANISTDMPALDPKHLTVEQAQQTWTSTNKYKIKTIPNYESY